MKTSPPPDLAAAHAGAPERSATAACQSLARRPPRVCTADRIPTRRDRPSRSGGRLGVRRRRPRIRATDTTATGAPARAATRRTRAAATWRPRTDRPTPEHELHGGDRQLRQLPGIASDASGRAMMAWFSSAAANRGVLAQGVNADGTPSGAVMTMPGSNVMDGRRDGVQDADRRAREERRLLRRLRARLPDRQPGPRVARRRSRAARPHRANSQTRAPIRTAGSGPSGATARSASRTCWRRARTRGDGVRRAGRRRRGEGRALDLLGRRVATAARSTSSRCSAPARVGRLDVPRARAARADAEGAQSGGRARSPSPTPATRCAARR